MSESWRDNASCKGAPSEIFYPYVDATGKTRNRFGDAHPLAVNLCSACPVREECLSYALSTHEWDGYWGGKTPEERRKLLRCMLKERRPTRRLTFDCGTPEAKRRHRSDGITCRKCAQIDEDKRYNWADYGRRHADEVRTGRRSV